MSTSTPFRNPIITSQLVARIVENVPARTHGIHGLPHWLRVERNGLYLAHAVGADTTVASFFALFHDARRINDGADPGHGARGARLAEEVFREGALPIDENQLELLTQACEHHTDETFSDDLTIGCCWDADRLDLPRVGNLPDPRYLNTEPARRIAGSGNYEPLESFEW